MGRRSRYFNPRSPDGERPERISMSAISRDFNPRSPDGERLLDGKANNNNERFQSTLPGWGATGGLLVAAEEQHHFNPRSPDGERRVEQSLLVPMPGISIHAPRMGSDVRVIARMPFGDPISIHAPRMGSDRRGRHLPGRQLISIHAPRMGSDHPDVDYLIVANQFQSTLPGWGATIAGACDGDRQRFQSTLPGWGATRFRYRP
ncbi:hypothetical protein NRBB09_1410 [Bifidobacterium breve]|nr:hypothetical protein NRBB09_1410 [Bifidobacterium breve]